MAEPRFKVGDRVYVKHWRKLRVAVVTHVLPVANGEHGYMLDVGLKHETYAKESTIKTHAQQLEETTRG